MKTRSFYRVIGIIAICFLYTGSVYMSQFYRLTEFYDAKQVDLITSFWNYLLQGGGIFMGILLFKKHSDTGVLRKWFAVLLLCGLPFAGIMQLAGSAGVIAAAGYVFNVLIGLYSAGYLILLSVYVPKKHAGLAFAAAYALGSLGTYGLSLPGNGHFLESKGILSIYVLLALLAAGLLLAGGEDSAEEFREEATADEGKERSLFLIAMIVAVMTLVSVTGSGLFYSFPQADTVNWILIRAFYAAGLITAGFVTDRSRWLGEALTCGSLIYPVIAVSLAGEGVGTTAYLAAAYLFRGFLTVYYVISFTDIAAGHRQYTFLAPAGLMISRFTEAVLTIFFMEMEISVLAQILLAAAGMIPLFILVMIKAGMTRTAGEPDPQKRLAMYADKYMLTARESEILQLLSTGMTDDEISVRTNISRSTVRFHISNILKKTGTSSRVEAVRSLQKFG